MSDNINLIDDVINWLTVYNPYELELYKRTFSISNIDKSRIWHTNCFFASGGVFGNMSSNLESRWEIGYSTINIFNLNNDLTRTIDLKHLVGSEKKTDLELPAKIVYSDKYILFYQDGTRELAGKNFAVTPNLLTYEGNPSQHIDSNLICPPVYLGQAPTSKLLLQFDVKVDDVFDFMGDDTFFIIVGHEKSIFNFSNTDLDIKKLSMNFENLTSKKWKTIAIEIQLSSNYISVGPFLTQKGHAEFKNIKLTELHE